jgi:hypothetical protein
MILAVALQSLAAVSIAHPFVFPGEWFQVTGLGTATIAEKDNVVSRSGVFRVTRPGKASFLARTANDARIVEIPVALAPAPDFSAPSGNYSGAGLLHRSGMSIAIVPLTDGFGAILQGRRIAPVFALNASARSSPKRARAFGPAYMYAGREHLTIIARPGGIAAITIVVEPPYAKATIVARYDLEGEVLFFGKTTKIGLRQAESAQVSVSLNDLVDR